MLIIDCDVCKINTSSKSLHWHSVLGLCLPLVTCFPRLVCIYMLGQLPEGSVFRWKPPFSPLWFSLVCASACMHMFLFQEKTMGMKRRVTDHNMNRSSLLILWDPKVNGHDHFLLLCVTSLLCCIQHYSFHSNILGWKIVLLKWASKLIICFFFILSLILEEKIMLL